MTSRKARKVVVEGTCRRRQIGGRDPARVTLMVWTVRADAAAAPGLRHLVLAMTVILPPHTAAASLAARGSGQGSG